MAILLNEALSGVLGSISLTCWIFLIVPQLWENFRNHSAEGLSLLFLLTWLLGDICNLAGAAWAKLLPTVIGIGAYFCFIDALMLGQLFYYNYYKPMFLKRRRHQRSNSHSHSHSQAASAAAHLLSNETDETVVEPGEPSPTDPLLGNANGETTHRHHHSDRDRRKSRSHEIQRRDSLTKALLDDGDEEGSLAREIIRNFISVLFVILAGTAGWLVAFKTGALKSTPEGGDGEEAPFGALVLGYASSFFYLTARLPQIYYNAKRQSCEGLSILFFILSTLGNLTYGASILAYSTEHTYVIKNLAWLLGSLGTMAEDSIIFAQFYYYMKKKPTTTSTRLDAQPRRVSSQAVLVD